MITINLHNNANKFQLSTLWIRFLWMQSYLKNSSQRGLYRVTLLYQDRANELIIAYTDYLYCKLEIEKETSLPVVYHINIYEL